jgi:2-polyprenyl-3-methyl-5-hydroxy-6-metoxy-1,4-benzoquinol methylase
MRALGYYDAYLGFLSEPGPRAKLGARVLDAGCGTGAFAEAWVAIQGPGHQVTLLDPSEGMLRSASAALARRGVEARCAACPIESFAPDAPFDCLLAAHVIEHAEAPVALLSRLREMAAPGGRLWLVVSKPHWCNAIIWFKWRHRAYAPEAVREMLGRAGWALASEYAFPSGPPSRTSRGYLAEPL